MSSLPNADNEKEALHAAAPNYAHCLDASHTSRVVNAATPEGGTNVAALGGVPFVGALDALDNVFAALGTKRLLSSYSSSSPLVTLRRSSDNAELDFAPGSDGWLVAADISSWIGGGTAFVKTIFDQSGNLRPATQTTTAKQPSLDLTGANPTIKADGSTQYMEMSAGVSFANNKGALSVMTSRKYASTGATERHFLNISINTAGTTSRVFMGRRAANSKFHIGGRRTDADSFVGTSGITADTNWGIQIGRWDFANAKLYHRVDATQETLDPFQTAGSTPNNDSANFGIFAEAGTPTNYADVQITALAFFSDLLTDTEADALVGVV